MLQLLLKMGRRGRQWRLQVAGGELGSTKAKMKPGGSDGATGAEGVVGDVVVDEAGGDRRHGQCRACKTAGAEEVVEGVAVLEHVRGATQELEVEDVVVRRCVSVARAGPRRLVWRWRP